MVVVDQSDPLEYAGGEFDEDEPAESVKAARDLKKPAVSLRGKLVSVIQLTASALSRLLVTTLSRQTPSRFLSQFPRPLRRSRVVVVSRK